MSLRRRARDAIMGRFVTLAYAAAHAASTIVETVRRTVKKP